MRVRRKHLNYLLSVMLLSVTVAIAMTLYQMQSLTMENRLLQRIAESDPMDIKYQGESFRIWFHLALRNRELKRYDEAIENWSLSDRYAPQSMRHRIAYNLGNTYLEQAIEVAENHGIDRAIALADVAKAHFRNALIVKPDYWPAKYNYEAAQRLSRDLPLKELSGDGDAAEESQELWSAMPGFPIGLP